MHGTRHLLLHVSVAGQRSVSFAGAQCIELERDCTGIALKRIHRVEQIQTQSRKKLVVA